MTERKKFEVDEYVIHPLIRGLRCVDCGAFLDEKPWFTCSICIPSDTLILTNPTFRPISQLSCEDEVAGMSAHQRILETFERDFVGDLISVSVRYLGKFKFTPEHPILVKEVFKKRNVRKKPAVIHELRGLMWKKASDVVPSRNSDVGKHYRGGLLDCVVVPKLNEEQEIFLDLRQFIKPRTSMMKLPSWIKVPTAITKELAELMGWYVAEGFPGTSSLCFALSSEEKGNIKRVKSLIRRLGYSPYVVKQKNEKSVVIQLPSRILARAFPYLFGYGAHNKKVPSFLFKAKKEVVKAFLTAYIKGDGHKHKEVKKDYCRESVQTSSCSENLTRQIQLLGLKIGIISSYSSSVTASSNIAGRTIRESKKFILSATTRREGGNRRLRLFYEDDDFYYFPITKIEKENFSGIVYNLRTEEGIYMLPFIVHNCGKPVCEDCRKKHIPLCMAKTWRMVEETEEGELIPVGKAARYAL